MFLKVFYSEAESSSTIFIPDSDPKVVQLYIYGAAIILENVPTNYHFSVFEYILLKSCNERYMA